AVAELRLVGADLAGNAGDQHFGLYRGDAQLETERGGGAALQRQLAAEFAEPALAGGDDVVANRQAGKGELAGRVTLGAALLAGSGVHDPDLYAGQQGATLIHDLALKGCGIRSLRQGGDR